MYTAVTLRSEMSQCLSARLFSVSVQSASLTGCTPVLSLVAGREMPVWLCRASNTPSGRRVHPAVTKHKAAGEDGHPVCVAQVAVSRRSGGSRQSVLTE
jgi:hypothetical protein